MTIDGLQAIFGAALAPLFGDGVLHKATLTDDGAGGFAATTTDVPIKVAIETVSQKDRAASALPLDVVTLTVLRAGLPVAIVIDDTLTVEAATYRVIAVTTDSGRAAFAVTGVQV